MARLSCLLLFPLLCFILPTLQSARHGFPPDLLHVNAQDELEARSGQLINSISGFTEFVRSKRSVKFSPGAGDSAAAAAAATTADIKKTEPTTTSQPKPSMTNASSQPFGASDSIQNAKNIVTMVSTQSNHSICLIFLVCMSCLIGQVNNNF